MNLIDKIKAIAKEGVDFSEIETEINQLNPLNQVKDKNQAWDFIKGNPLLLSVLDTKVTDRANTALENFKSSKLPELIEAEKEALRKELKPEETPLEKEVRELREARKQDQLEMSRRDLQDKLSVKAKELDFDPIRAKNYAVYGEEAIDRLTEDATWFKSEIETRIGVEKKGLYAGVQAPKISGEISSIASLSDNDLHRVAHENPEMKQSVLEEISRRTKPKN
jgi:hypothetical protein